MKLRLTGGLFVLSDEMDSVYLDVDASNEMNAKTRTLRRPRHTASTSGKQT